MVAKDVDIHSYYWNETNKFKLEIGVKNPFEKYQQDYPIIWFKQGTYVITSFNSSLNNNNYTISISGKDKMCMLNGDLGGNLPASIDFGCIDEYDSVYKVYTFKDYAAEYKANKYYILTSNDNDEYKYELATEAYDPDQIYYEKETILTQKDLTLETIIRHAIHAYANEPYHNIIINDLSDYGLELIEYRGDTTLYAMYNTGISQYTGLVANGDFKVNVEGKETSIKDIEVFNAGINIFNNNPTEFKLINASTNAIFTATNLNYGDTVGYRQTELVYPGELITSIGETLTSLLDKIKNMLGSFEYFYDLDGRFIFQAKKIYSNTSWNPIVEADGNKFVRDSVEESPYSYNFEDINLISQFSSTPNLQNVKNDYSIWGVRKGVSGAEIPIHARYAIHNKPTYYKSLGNNGQGKYYGVPLEEKDGKKLLTQTVREPIVYYAGEEPAAAGARVVDWREIIYEMAIDYFQHNEKDDYLYQVEVANILNGISLYPLGKTNYEMFYTDMQGFWRQLYDIDLPMRYSNSGGEFKRIRTDLSDGDYTVITEWVPYKEEDGECDYFTEGDYKYWHKNILQAPELLNFWIDFYNEDTEIFKYSIMTIGDRPKVVNDNKINSVYYRGIPQVVVYFPDEEKYLDPQPGYTYFKLTDSMRNVFTISAQGRSANDEVNNLMNQHSYYSESISITAIPIYDLQPNTLIYMYNEENNINGKYCVDRLTIPLAYNGTMSINATKIIDATL